MTTPKTAARPGLLARLRNPRAVDLVQVTFTGTAPAVSAVARALASVTVITAMRHQVDPDQVHLDEPQIRLDATCHAIGRGGAR
jgi:hypothetical protein